MKYKIENNDTEYTTKEMLAYFLQAHKKVEEKQSATLSDYMKEIIYAVEQLDRYNIMVIIETSLISQFPIAHILNNEELICYALKIFFTLLNSNKKITEEDIISQAEAIMSIYSSRKILAEAENILNII